MAQKGRDSNIAAETLLTFETWRQRHGGGKIAVETWQQQPHESNMAGVIWRHGGITVAAAT